MTQEHVSDSYADTEDRVGTITLWLAAVPVTLAFFWAYWPTLLQVTHAWDQQPDYSHGYLVAPIAAFFLYDRRRDFPHSRVGLSWIGAAAFLVVLGIRLFAAIYYLEPLDAWTIPLWVAATVWMLLGWSSLVWSAPGIIFLYFMFPMPYSAERWLSVPLQSLATKLSAVGLVLLGQPAVTEGTTIWVGEHQLFVADACSGLRIFIGIFAVAYAYILFVRQPWWMKITVMFAALPVAVIANVLRIVVTALLYQYSSGEAARRFSHDFAGLVMIPVAAAIFAMFVSYLQRLLPEVESVSSTDLHEHLLDAGRS